MTILEALDQPELFGSHFRGWDAWRSFLAACFALPPARPETYREHTGREDWPDRQAREAWMIVGRRGGKSRIAAVVAVYVAGFRDYTGVLAAGEVGTLPIIAADRSQARTVMGYVRGLLDGSDVLRRLVVNETAESIELSTRVRIEIHTASWRALRGYTVVGAVLDEVAFWRSDDCANPDAEILNALRPAMATVPGALLMAISSPHARRGVLWDAFRKHYGKPGDVLVWRAPTRAMHPAVPEALVTQALEEDEGRARAEWLAEFRTDVESFVSREVVEAAVVPGRFELPKVSSCGYVGFLDPSGGSADSFTLGIAHGEIRDGQIVAVLDLLREKRPPFSPDAVVQDYAELLKRYGCARVLADRYAGAWVTEAFVKAGVHVEQSAEPKSVLYASMLPLLNAGRVELLEHTRLVAQLLGLERRVARGGRESIDHGPGAHDDVANAAAGVLVLAAGTVGAGAPVVRDRSGGPRAPRMQRIDWAAERREHLI